MTSDIALHPYQWLHLRIQPITHKLKLPIRGYEAYGPIVLKPRESHTLMEFHVLHLHRLPPCRPTRGLKHDFVIQSQAKLRHTTEVTF